MWRAWGLDAPTWGWIGWLAAFIALETWAITSEQPIHTLTSHLRPLFLSAPITWWIALGLWGWIGVHMLAPDLERWLIDAVGKGTP